MSNVSPFIKIKTQKKKAVVVEMPKIAVQHVIGIDDNAIRFKNQKKDVE